MFNISGFGTQISLIASSTFPNGIVLSQFANDADPIDISELKIGEADTALNGDLVVYSKPAVLHVAMNFIPNSDDDKNLQILFNNNRISKNHSSARDVITIVVVSIDGTKQTFNNGIMLTGFAGNSIASAGKYKSKKYSLAFEDMTIG